MIGASLSFCIRDIVAGHVALANVEKIVTSTAARTAGAWDGLISEYQRTYWTENPQECARVTRELLAAGKIEQPRLTIGKCVWLAHMPSHWVTSEQQIVYTH